MRALPTPSLAAPAPLSPPRAPARSPAPRALSSLLPAPRPPSPRNQCSCRRSGCGFLQSLPRPPLLPERARSPAQQRPLVPSCEPRPQPPPAPRSRLPGPPARPPRSGRRTGPRRPHPNPGGRSGSEAGGCQLTPGCLRAGGRAGGEGARAGARDATAALRPGGRGGGERALGARRAPQ